MRESEEVVFVVDDDASLCDALGSLLRSAGFRVESFASARAFLEHPRPALPSCLVLDVQLPDLTGLDLQRQLADAIPIVFITGHGDVPTSVRAMKAGALEFLTKPFEDHELLDAIRHAMQRDRSARAEHAALADLAARHATLTPREVEVMALVVAGLLNKQIASELGVSEVTVKVHRGRVMQKMQADSLADLVRMAERLEARPPRR